MFSIGLVAGCTKSPEAIGSLKTAEGTANFITDELKKVFKDTILGKLSSILNFINLKNSYNIYYNNHNSLNKSFAE